MGLGEVYWRTWTTWFEGLPAEARASYKEAWPEPEHWEGFYAFVETDATPPWILERRGLVEAAVVPPAPDESVIKDYYRVLWLIRQHFKRLRSDTRQEDESLAEIYVAPDGSEWRLSASTTEGGLHFSRMQNDLGFMISPDSAPNFPSPSGARESSYDG